MKRKLSKILSVVLAVTMVISSDFTVDFKVKADITTVEMVASAQYNLALKKSVIVSPSVQEGEAFFVTDGQFTPGGNHAATKFEATGAYYQIDLGEVYDLSTLDQLVVGYKEDNDGDIPAKGYKIQISANGLDFTEAKSVPGTHVKDACKNNNLIEETSLADANGKNVRYVRLYYPDAYTWGIQVTEIAILDTDGNAQTVEVEKCDKPAGLVVDSPDYNTVSFRVVAGKGQENYRYMVYLVNAIDKVSLIGNGVEAEKDYSVDYQFAGMYTVKAVACYNGMISDEIVSEKFNVDDLSNLIRSKRNIANAYAGGYPAKIVEMQSIYEGHTLETAANAIDGTDRLGETPDNAMRTGVGSPQYFVIDLGDYYTPSEMEEVILAYTNAGTFASDAKIEFSLDGKKYTEVANGKGYDLSRKSERFCATNRIKLDKVANYTEKALRYVKITLSGGGGGVYGYVVNEVSVITNTNTPTIAGTNAAEIIVDTSDLETIKYTIVAGDNQEDATYVVSLGDNVINEEAKAGVEYKYEGVEIGTYEFKVQTIEDGWLSKGITKKVNIVPDMPTNVSAVSPKYNTILVKWDDIANKSAVYKIYVDGKLMATEAAEVNQKTFKVTAGNHTIKVCAMVNDVESESEDVSVKVETEPSTVNPTDKATDEASKQTTNESSKQQADESSNQPTTGRDTLPVISVKKPGRVKIKKVREFKKKISVKYQRVKEAKGYKVQYSLKANFEEVKTITTKKLQVKINKLKSGKRYYIRVRAYKVVNRKKIYGAYSKKVKTKKIK